MSSFLSVGLSEREGMLVAQKVLNARGLLAYARDHQLKKVGVLHDSTQVAKVKAADNIVFPEYLIAEDPLPTQQAFVEACRKEYGKLPKHFSAAGWDAVMALAEAYLHG